MACESWRDKIAAYADAELSAGEMRAMGEHIKGCASCASDALSRVQLRSAIKTTGKRFSPSPALGRRIRKELPAKRNWVRHGSRAASRKTRNAARRYWRR